MLEEPVAGCEGVSTASALMTWLVAADEERGRVLIALGACILVCPVRRELEAQKSLP